MPTNDERREVAARLRDMAPGSDWPNYVAEACGMDVSKMSNNFHTFTEQLCRRIADLIEPQERTCRMHRDDHGVWHCSNCDDAEMGGEGIVSWCDSWAPDFCPNCGARVVDE